MKRLLVYKPAAQRELSRMDRSDAERMIHSLEVLAATGHGDVKALKGALNGRGACSSVSISLALSS